MYDSLYVEILRPVKTTYVLPNAFAVTSHSGCSEYSNTLEWEKISPAMEILLLDDYFLSLSCQLHCNDTIQSRHSVQTHHQPLNHSHPKSSLKYSTRHQCLVTQVTSYLDHQIRKHLYYTHELEDGRRRRIEGKKSS
jgi:hypothetical protein